MKPKRGTKKIGEYVTLRKRRVNDKEIYYMRYRRTPESQAWKSKSTGETIRTDAEKIAEAFNDELKAAYENPAKSSTRYTVGKIVRLRVEKLEEDVTSGKASTYTKTRYLPIYDRFLDLCHDKGVEFADQLTVEHFERYAARRVKDGRKPKSIYTELICLRSLVNFAVERKYLQEDPLGDYKVPESASAMPHFWTHAEGLEIAEAADGVYKSAFMTLLLSGMRSGELCHLEWRDVDLGAGLVRIREKDYTTINSQGKKVKGHWRPKHRHEREFPISPKLREVLESLPRICNWVFPLPPSGQNAVVGRKMTGKRLLERLKPILKARREADQEEKKECVHTFRHTFISHALTDLKHAVPPAVLMKWVGHFSDGMLAHYTHLAQNISSEHMRLLHGGADTEEK